MSDFSNSYISSRKKGGITAYGLERRIDILNSNVIPLIGKKKISILDIGTADGALLNGIIDCFNVDKAVGVDVNIKLLKGGLILNNIIYINADATRLPLKDNSFDVVLITSTLKHIKNVDNALMEINRVLKCGGIFVAIEPTPIGIEFGIAFGYFDSRYIYNKFSIKKWIEIFNGNNFGTIKYGKFMLSPVSFKLFNYIEKALNKIKLNGMFISQYYIGVKL